MPKSPEELKAEHLAELKRQLEFLKSDAVAEWKEKFPKRHEEDVARVEKELSELADKPKVAEKASKSLGAKSKK